MVGAEVRLPPLSSLPRASVAGETSAQRYWLYEEAERADILVVSLETLTLGGALATHPSDDAPVMQRLGVLRELRRRHPQLQILAHARLRHALEDAHFAPWASALEAYSVAADRRERYGEQGALEEARAALPPAVLSDWLMRRGGQSRLCWQALEMVREGVINHLTLSFEGAEVGLDALERRQLQARTDELGLWPQVDLTPGGPEAACMLMARALEPRRLQAWVGYSGAGGPESLLGAQRGAEVVRAQLRAAGCLPASSLADADFALLVNVPGRAQGQSQPDYAGVDTEQRNLPAFADELEELLGGSLPVVLADVAYLGAAEVRLWKMMQHLPLSRLSGYAAWGSAGSALGCAIAFGKLAPRVQNRDVQRAAVFGRLLADGLYQAAVRPRLSERLGGVAVTSQPISAEKALGALLLPAAQRFWDEQFAGEWQPRFGAPTLLGDDLSEVSLPFELGPQ